MAKRTAIIDIGSNSARLVIYEKTSRYGFNLICDQKSKVRIGEGAYEKGGNLQPIGIKRAFLALKSFKDTIEKYKANKTICVATSAIRDAPNGKSFIEWIQKELKISIKVIDGKKEAYYGAISALNLLPFKDGITIDIGGGSSDMALIKNGHIVDTFSLNLGTVRLKELFFDKSIDTTQLENETKAYIQRELKRLPKEFNHFRAIGIGGTARALSKGIMKTTKYPLDKIHAFCYSFKEQKEYMENISFSKIKSLKAFELPKSRFDTIREGTLILYEILNHIEAKEVVTSGVGVREGLYLEQLLKRDSYKFPVNLNPSIVSILDRFKPTVCVNKNKKDKQKITSNLYSLLSPLFDKDKKYEEVLFFALKLYSVGEMLTIYKSHQHAFYIATQELNFGFKHQDILLISILLRLYGKVTIPKPLYEEYKELLPSKEIIHWLGFIYSLSTLLYEASNSAIISFKYENKILEIYSNKSLYLGKEKIKSLPKPISFAIICKDEVKIPKNRILNIESLAN